MLQKLLEAKLAMTVQNQISAGIGPVPKADADDILTKVAQLDASKVRGIIVIVATDLEDPERGAGIDVSTFIAGTDATLDPLMELASFQLDEKLSNPSAPIEGEVCPGCGEVHDLEGGLEELLRRGPSRPRGDSPSAGLGLLMALLAKGRAR